MPTARVNTSAVGIRYFKGGKIMAQRRKDNKGRVLKSGESQRSDGTYMYRYSDAKGKRYYIYSRTLEELREKEEEIQHDRMDGLKAENRYYTLNNAFEKWAEVKRGLKDNTFQVYCYMYKMFVESDLGRMRIVQIKHSDVRRFYNTLYDEKGLKVSTIDNIHTVLHQIFELAVQDNYLRSNPSDHALKELKLAHNSDSEKRFALTKTEQAIFLEYLKTNKQYQHWYPIFSVMVHTGLRVGEITGLRWCDIDLKTGMIDVNHTLVYYNHRQNGCYYNIHKPKTKFGTRIVPMLNDVKESFEQERYFQEVLGINCKAEIDGYTDFIFVNRFGNVHNQSTLNKALRRIIRDCNNEILENSCGDEVTLLPKFSCHSLRHTFATRMCEAKINIKVIQDILGHADFSTTMNIYTDATKDLKESEFKTLEEFLNSDKDSNQDNDS